MPSVFLVNTDLIIKYGDETHILNKGQRISNSHPIFALIKHKYLSSIGTPIEPGPETVVAAPEEVKEVKHGKEEGERQEVLKPKRRRIKNVV